MVQLTSLGRVPPTVVEILCLGLTVKNTVTYKT